MPRPTVTLEGALQQLRSEALLTHVKEASVETEATLLRKLAAEFRSAASAQVTYDDLNTVRATVYGRG